MTFSSVFWSAILLFRYFGEACLVAVVSINVVTRKLYDKHFIIDNPPPWVAANVIHNVWNTAVSTRPRRKCRCLEACSLCMKSYVSTKLQTISNGWINCNFTDSDERKLFVCQSQKCISRIPYMTTVDLLYRYRKLYWNTARDFFVSNHTA